jgi:muramoyltetrapeptide carboxypeptidase
VLHEFARKFWGWSTLHAPMPAATNFSKLEPQQWQSIIDYVRGIRADAPWSHARLQWLTPPPAAEITTQLIGGNLALITSLIGTRYAPDAKNKILFLEDTGESFYRIDRMMVQLEQSGALDSAAAIVLGDFTDCNDETNMCRADRNTGAKKPLRKTFEQHEALEKIFTPIGNRLGIPIAKGLPVGHGPNFSALPLGAKYSLSTDGFLNLLNWDWLDARTT